MRMVYGTLLGYRIRSCCRIFECILLGKTFLDAVFYIFVRELDRNSLTCFQQENIMIGHTADGIDRGHLYRLFCLCVRHSDRMRIFSSQIQNVVVRIFIPNLERESHLNVV